MKRLECMSCGQAYWVGFTADEEAGFQNGDWITSRCPKCGSEWASLSGAKARRGRRPGRRPGPKPGRRPAIRPGMRAGRRKEQAPAGQDEEKGLAFSPSRIRSLRKKLGVSQKELAALTDVSSGAVALWEKGKFKPKKEKVSRLADLANMGKEDVRNLLAVKMAKGQAKEKTGIAEGKAEAEVKVSRGNGNARGRVKAEGIKAKRRGRKPGGRRKVEVAAGGEKKA